MKHQILSILCVSLLVFGFSNVAFTKGNPSNDKQFTKNSVRSNGNKQSQGSGQQSMTEKERQEHMKKINNAKTLEERNQYQRQFEHRQNMLKKNQEKTAN